MAIKFEHDRGAPKPDKKTVGGKTYVAEEPAPGSETDDTVLPFGKPKKPEKKGQKIRNK